MEDEMDESMREESLPGLAWTRDQEELHGELRKRFHMPHVSLPTNTPNAYEKVNVENNLAVPMRDGVKLYANVYRPDASGSFPVVLTRLPYGKDEPYCFMPVHGRYWAKKGYACVMQDVRGKYASEGTFEPFVNEANDGYDTLDWIARQPWCNGNIGMTGESYFGYTQLAAATMNHPNLKCIAPGVAALGVIYGSCSYNFDDNALPLQTMASWVADMTVGKTLNPMPLDYWHLPLITMDENAGNRSEFFKDLFRHPPGDVNWERSNVQGEFNQIKIPAFHWGGWYDVILPGTIRGWQGIKERSDSLEARKNQWLVVAPVDHELSPITTHRIGRIDIGAEAWSYDRIQRFFDYWLKGVDNGFSKTPRVEIFTIGDNKWRYEDEWPLARTKYTRHYLHSKGSANTAKGDGSLGIPEPGDEAVDHYVYDPNMPVTIAMEQDYWYLAETLKNRAYVERREDVLVYSTSKLEKDMEVTGPVTVTLFAASSARDTDFTATLVDVFPDGYAHMIQEGIVRARYRDSGSGASLLEPGKVYEYKIDLCATSYVVKKGHRIRVEISSSNFNRWDRNPNTGNEYGLDAETVKASQTVYHDEKHPSHITLPVIPR